MHSYAFWSYIRFYQNGYSLRAHFRRVFTQLGIKGVAVRACGDCCKSLVGQLQTE